MDRISRLRTKRGFVLFTIYVRYLLGGAFVYSGFGKATGGRFIPAGSRQIPEVGMSIDVFFETLYRTGIWWQFLGWAQVVTGFLLLTQRWSTLGAVAFLPISVNIFVITVSMDFHGTPLITGLMVLANVWLLCWDYPKLSILFLANRDASFAVRLASDQLNTPRYWETMGIVLFIASISFGNRESPLLWFALCLLVGVIGLAAHFVYTRHARNRGVLNA